MLHVILYHPQIPQNTGNIGRLCAITQTRLHLVHPLGFTISDKHLRRSGMDYWDQIDLHHHANWEAFIQSRVRPKRLWLFTTKAEQTFWDVKYAADDGLLFGNEGEGAPEWLHQEIGKNRITIPQANADMRSLNLSTAVGIAAYEALRQLR